MDYLQVLFFLVLAAAASAGFYVLAGKPATGNPLLAAMLSILFGGYTAIQIWREGAVMFFTNHTQNMTGIQVWWDLVMLVTIALFFIAPRARAVGMNVWLWALFVLPTASIGLLAMCARLFVLERRAPSEGARQSLLPGGGRDSRGWA